MCFLIAVELWKSHRKVMRSVFNNKVVEEYLEVIAEQGDVLVKQLNEKVDTGDFDVLKYVTACTLDIVFGKKFFLILSRIFERHF